MLRFQLPVRQRIMPIMIGIGLAVLLVAAVTAWLLLEPEPEAPQVASLPDPVATVNGVAITHNMVDREIKISCLNIVAPLPPLKGEDLTRAREEALNQLLTRQIVLQAATKQGFSLKNDLIQNRVDILFGAADDEALNTALAQADATYEDLFWWVAELTTVEEFTVQVIMANATPETRQRVYNDWLNAQQANAEITIFRADSESTFSALPGQPAPDFTLTTPDGQPISLSDYRGQVVLINFWATWCPSCIAEMPAYEAVYRRQPVNNFVVLGVNLQENAEHAQKFALGLDLSFPILLDQAGDITIRDYQVIGMPGSVIVDRQGTIFYRHIGPMSSDVLTEKLQELK